MTSLTSTSLSTETARLERAAADRRGSEAAPAGGRSGGFAGLLKAAGVQAGGAGGAGGLEGAVAEPAPAAPGRSDATREAQRRDAANEASRGSPRRTEKARAQADDPVERADRPARRAGVANAADPAEETPVDETTPAAADRRDDPLVAASGGATLAHWLVQMAAQRKVTGTASRAPQELPQGIESGGATGVAGAAPLVVPAWTRQGGDGVSDRGRWAGGGGAVKTDTEAVPGADLGRRDAAGIGGALLAFKPEVDRTGSGSTSAEMMPAGPAGHDLLSGFAGQLASLVGQAGPAPDAFVAPASVAGEAQVRTPVGAPGFGDEVMLKVAAFSLDGLQEAQLHLNPAELGPIQVRIAIDGTQARIDFGATADSTRVLLESALPALAQALQADGLELAASSVVSQVDAAGALDSTDVGASSPGAGDAGAGAGQGGAGDRAGGWGQQAEARAAAASNVRTVPAALARVQDAGQGWAGAGRPAGTSGLRGLDLYA